MSVQFFHVMASIAVLVALSLPAGAGVRSGFRLMKQEQYERARQELEKPAAAGNPRAQATLGRIYEFGLGTSIDQSMALDWYKRAAVQGSADAQLRLGYMVLRGQDLGVAPAGGVEWLVRAAEQGEVTAQYQLGELYRMGHEVPVDHALAAKWYRRCATKSSGRCQVELGLMHEQGQGLAKDTSAARDWFLEAANAGSKSGAYNLARLYLDGHVEPPSSRRAIELLEGSASDGYPAALLMLAGFYEEGKFVTQDRVRAFGLAARAAVGGEADAVALVDDWIDTLVTDRRAEILRLATQVDRDGNYAAAVLLYKFLAHRGDSPSQFRLGEMYSLGYGAAQNFVQAYMWLRLGQSHDPVHARSILARVGSVFTPAEIQSLDTAIERWSPRDWRFGDEPEVDIALPGYDVVSYPTRRHRVMPEYPERARSARLTAAVLLRAVITKEGDVADLYVERCGERGVGFEASALAAVNQWKYLPAYSGGAPVEVRYTIFVSYSLR